MRIPDNLGLVQDPIHLGAVILDKLKGKLSFGKKEKSSDETDVEEVSEDQTDPGSDESTETRQSSSLVTRLTSSFKLSKKSGGGDEKSKSVPNRRQQIIRGAIVRALVALVAQEFIPSEEPVAPAPIVKAPKRPKAAPVKDPDVPTDATVAEKPADGVTENPPTDPAATPPDASVTVTETPTEAAPTETPATPSEPVVTETPAPETPTEPVVTEAPVTETSPAEPVSEVPSEPVITEAPPEPVVTNTPVPEAPTEPVKVTEQPDSVDGSTPAPTTEDDLTDQILKDLEKQAKKDETPAVKKEYVSPPTYEHVGKGLVYNCTGKHWACVDGPSYKACQDNSAFNKENRKKTECHAYNVYQTQSGCESMQNRVVSSSAKTDFCSN